MRAVDASASALPAVNPRPIARAISAKTGILSPSLGLSAEVAFPVTQAVHVVAVFHLSGLGFHSGPTAAPSQSELMSCQDTNQCATA